MTCCLRDDSAGASAPNIFLSENLEKFFMQIMHLNIFLFLPKNWKIFVRDGASDRHEQRQTPLAPLSGEQRILLTVHDACDPTPPAVALIKCDHK